MSKQLKLNALHFSKSLEAEKGLLESTGHIIEGESSMLAPFFFPAVENTAG